MGSFQSETEALLHRVILLVKIICKEDLRQVTRRRRRQAAARRVSA